MISTHCLRTQGELVHCLGQLVHHLPAASTSPAVMSFALRCIFLSKESEKTRVARRKNAKTTQNRLLSALNFFKNKIQANTPHHLPGTDFTLLAF